MTGVGIKCTSIRPLTLHFTHQTPTLMESELRHHFSSLSNSTTKILTWLPRLSPFSPPNDMQGPVTAKADAVPGSLRDAHNAACAWFLGPKAENADHFKMLVETILDDLTQCRRNFSSEDKVSWLLSPLHDELNGLVTQDFVDAKIASSTSFMMSMSKLKTNVAFLSGLLPQHSVPFYSPRYMAHMVNDVSMPATLGYFMGLLYNPNNISPEAGPLTHVIEYDVGQQLCGMLGYNAQLGTQPAREGPTAWGHITCDGSVANMESMW
jgi:hypothetical protein